ncbi:MAG: HEAT repeat domain-containing protein [Pirellulaceae bacterium]|nr:HEAT repeat domain-containing protein [Pirellulaceae bacterium]
MRIHFLYLVERASSITLVVVLANLVLANLVSPNTTALAQEPANPTSHSQTADANDSTTVDQVAGRTVEQYASELDDPNRVVRLRAVKSLGAFGPSAGDALQKALDHDDHAVQYTAAVHLGRIGGPPLNDATERLTELAKQKDSQAVRIAASYALCRGGQIDPYLSVLTDALSYPDRGTVCSTAELLGMLGATAKAAIDPLDAVYQTNKPGVKGGDYHIGGAANNALRKIRGK